MNNYYNNKTLIQIKQILPVSSSTVFPPDCMAAIALSCWASGRVPCLIMFIAFLLAISNNFFLSISIRSLIKI